MGPACIPARATDRLCRPDAGHARQARRTRRSERPVRDRLPAALGAQERGASLSPRSRTRVPRQIRALAFSIGQSCTLLALLEAMKDHFSRDPPLYARPPAQPQAPVQPSPPAPAPHYASKPPPLLPGQQHQPTASPPPPAGRPALPPKPTVLPGSGTPVPTATSVRRPLFLSDAQERPSSTHAVPLPFPPMTSPLFSRCLSRPWARGHSLRRFRRTFENSSRSTTHPRRRPPPMYPRTRARSRSLVPTPTSRSGRTGHHSVHTLTSDGRYLRRTQSTRHLRPRLYLCPCHCLRPARSPRALISISITRPRTFTCSSISSN
jgi:hypothetical protein